MIRVLRFGLELVAVLLVVLGLVWCANRAPYALAAGLVIVAVLVWVVPRARRPHVKNRGRG